jgi:hypothetical protein
VTRSADSRAGETSRASIEKRRGERLQPNGHLRGEVMVFQPMTVLNISATGVQIQTAFPLQFASEHDFRLLLGHESVIVRGRVAYCHISELTDTAAVYRSGIGFVDLPPGAVDAIGEFVSAIQPARS